MKSATKTPLLQEEILLIMQKHFGQAVSLSSFVELSDGWFNTAYFVQILNPSMKLVLKVAPHKTKPAYTYETNAMEIEVFTYHLIQSKTHIKIPKIYGSDFSETLIKRKYFLMEFLEGSPWNKLRSKLTKDQNKHIELEVAQYQFEMNQLTNSTFGAVVQIPKNQFASNSWGIAFSQLVSWLVSDYPRFSVKVPQYGQKLIAYINQNMSVFDAVKEPRLVHWDLWEGNIFIKKDEHNSYSVEGITDFERALWADPLIELFFHKPQNYPSIVELYEQRLGKDWLSNPKAQIRRLSYNMYLYLIWVLESYTRGYPWLFSFGLRKVAYFSMKRTWKMMIKLKG